MRGTKFVGIFAFWWAITSSFLAFAKVEYPPQFRSIRSLNQHARTIRRLVPETSSSEGYELEPAEMQKLLQREQKLVRRLKKNKNYNGFANLRQPRQTFLVEKINDVITVGRTVSSPWNDLLSASGIDQISPDQAFAELKELFRSWPATASVSFFSGWAAILKPEERRLLSEPDLTARWELIKKTLASESIETLRTKFNADRFGISRADWTMADLDAFVEQIDGVELRLIVLLDAANKREKDARPWILSEKINPEILALNADSPRIEKLLVSLKNRALKLYATDDGEIRTVQVHKQLILREIPPYLAIFRGCVGQDCSTSDSALIPYVPNSRNWWIEDTQGMHLGYVAGSITHTEGKSSLYIHDVAGPKLSKDDIPLILTGLYQMRNDYGAAVMTIMSKAFTWENHSPTHAKALRGYASSSQKKVKQDFYDSKIRNSVFQGGGWYDSLDRHTDVRLVEPSAEMVSAVRITKLENDIIGSVDPMKSPDRFWQTLTVAVKNDDGAYLDDVFGKDKFDWRPLLRIIENKNHLPVSEYYEAVAKEFERLGLPYSNNLAKKHDFVFLEGQLNAKDAFTPENQRDAVRFVMDLLWRSPNPDRAVPFVSKHLELFENDELMIRNVRTLFKRAEQEDIGRIEALFEAGYRFQKQKLKDDDLLFLMSSYNFSLRIIIWAWHRKLSQFPIAPVSAFKMKKEFSARLASLLNNDNKTREFAAEALYRLHKAINRDSMAKYMTATALGGTWRPRSKVNFLAALTYLRDARDVRGIKYYKAFEVVLEKRDEVSSTLKKEALKIFEHIAPGDRQRLERRYRYNHDGDYPDWYATARCATLLE